MIGGQPFVQATDFTYFGTMPGLFAVNGYEIVYPFQADSVGNKRELSNGLNGEHQEEVTFVLKREAGDMVLELKRNVGFHADKVLMRTFDENGSLKSEMYAPKSCYYSGNIADHGDSYVIMDTCDGLRGSIEDGAKRYNLAPIEGMQADGAHELYEIENNDEELLKRTVGIDPFLNDYIELSNDANYDATTDTGNSVESDEYSQTSLVPDVDPVYANYSITKKTRYCEMYLVIDHAIYVKYNSSKKLVLSRMLNMIHAVDRSYAAVNVRVVLVAIEIWTNGNRIPYDTSGGAQLSLFNKYRKSNLLGTIRHDIAHFMSIKGWSKGVIGMAYVGGVCHTGHGTAINLWSFRSITGTNVVVAHELGHNFGFPHDNEKCKCLTSRGCFMGGPKSRRPGFSDCNMKVLSDPKRAFNCLNNYPRGSLDNVCGNGIIEGSEECDCGTIELCKRKDSCCQPHSCKLKRSAQCSDFNTPDCCKNCLFKKQGTLCRRSQNNCDLPEYCTGESPTCPADVYKKDGTMCSNKVSIITGSTSRAERSIVFNPPIKARYFRFNPIYWPNGWACMRMELLTCSADEDVVHLPQPISTRDLQYTQSLCLGPDSSDCNDSKTKDPAVIFRKEDYGDCNKPNYLFTLENDGTLRHNCSGKIVCPDSKNFLFLKSKCPDEKGKYKRLANFGLRHVKTGGCVEAYYGWPGNNKKAEIRWTKDCNGRSDRTKLQFLATDCLIPAGMQNGKLPDSAFSATSFGSSNPPKEARLRVGKAWCAKKSAGKDEYLQIDLGIVKTLSSMRLQGNYWNWVSGFKLFFSDNAKDWKGYSSNDDMDKNSTSYCYSGACGKSLNLQCNDLWNPGARSADPSCWNKLNSEANGFGTCDHLTNKTCDKKDVFCGQLQCSSNKKAPVHVKYGSVYKEMFVNGSKCSAASITIPGSLSDQVGDGLGMVADGTKCGYGKICSGYSCMAIIDLNITQCPVVQGKECAGRGICDNKGKCHCSEGLDPMTNCTLDLQKVDGKWGPWTDWSICNAACNSGTKRRSRFCDSPFPAHGGSDCVGDGYEENTCNADACPKAKSCKLLKKKLKDSNKPMVDGVYYITLPDGSSMPMYCDMTRDGGGWTLVVTAHTNNWTSSDMVREFNKNKPSLWDDYSILKHVDQIKENYDIYDDKFEYRLEAHARGRWGGIWSAPIVYKFDTESSSQTDVKLNKKFDKWTLGDKAIQNRMPHIIGNCLTTQTRANHWGSITGNKKGYHPAPWILGELTEAKPEYIWYWMREGHYKRSFSCTELRLRALKRGHKPKSGSYEIQSSNGKVINTLCDMDSFGGGWTLVLNRVSNKGWTKTTTLSRSVDNASKSKDYSILSYSKGIINLKQQEETKFQYLIEADGHQRWGGIFEARIEDALALCNVYTKKPTLLRKFDSWDESESNLAKRVPYLIDNPSSYLTTEETERKSHPHDIISIDNLKILLSPSPLDFGASYTLKTDAWELVHAFPSDFSVPDSTDRIIIEPQLPLQASIGEDGVLVSATSSIYIKGSKEKPKFVRTWVREATSKKSCNEIKVKGQRKGVSYKNGFYIAKKSDTDIRTLYCDMTSDVGAWTLLVTSAQGNWTKDQVLSRNGDLPSIHDDYSILDIADSIKKMSNNDTFKYKLDAKRFNHWGGIFEAPIEYTFFSTSNKQTKVKLLQQFDKWTYNSWHSSVNNRMPWLGRRKGILTTSGTSDSSWWGTIVSDNLEYDPAPWINSQMKEPGVIWYWINEDDCSLDREPVNGGFTEWSTWTPCSVNCGNGKSSRIRTCTAPKQRCGGTPCDPEVLTKETKECSGKCLVTPMRSHDSRFCVLPKNGKCEISDETVLQWKSGIDKCDLPEAQFIVDYDRGSIIHQCSGKPVCPSGGSSSNGRKVVISSKCPAMKLKKRFTRTMSNTLHFGDKCIHPNGGWPNNNVNLVMWSGCEGERLEILLYKTEQGPVHAKFWKDVKLSTSTIFDLLNDTRFPNNPTSSGFLDNFDSPYSIGSRYGLQMWGYFMAPETGQYIFHSACDDHCQVFLSTSDREGDKKLIIDQNGWSPQYKYDQRSDQHSKKISLTKGKLYYLESILIEFGGGDHLSVAVDLPSGSSLIPITGYYLRAKG